MKAVGPDEIPNEFFKEGGEKIEEGLLDLFESIDEEEEVPIEWNKVQVKLAFKHGKKEKRDIKKYRPVPVANTISNIFCGIIKDKMTNIIEEEELIGEEQNGFRKDRRGTENLCILKELIEKAGKENKQLYCMLLDMEKAYDTVNRKIMWELVERLGFDEHIRKILQSTGMYRNTIAKYHWNEVVIDEVKSEIGLRQGCTLSPLLFMIVMEELTQRIKKTDGNKNWEGNFEHFAICG